MRRSQLLELPWFPVVLLVQLLLTLGLALILSALTVHFRDLKDILGNVMTLWFFATPIIYYWKNAPEQIRPFLNLNPFTHLAIIVSGDPVFPCRSGLCGGPPGHWKWLLALGAGSDRAVPVRLFPVRSTARLVCGRGMRQTMSQRKDARAATVISDPIQKILASWRRCGEIPEGPL